MAGTVSSVGAGVSVWLLSLFCLGFGIFKGELRDISGGICPGVRLILAVDAPEANIFAGGGACFFLRGQSERLCVECRFYL